MAIRLARGMLTRTDALQAGTSRRLILTIKKLQELRSSASPWQQEAIDRIIPVAQKLASNTQAAIERLNKNPLHLQDRQYQSYLKSNAKAAKQLASLVRDFVEYGKTRSTLEAMERKLEVHWFRV